MKRKLKWMAVILAVLLAGFGAVLFLSPRDRITSSSLTRIDIGMTEKEVDEILGGPGKVPPFSTIHVTVGPNVPKNSRFWIGRNGLIEVEFDNDGHVIDKDFHRVQGAEPDFIDRLRDWLGL